MGFLHLSSLGFAIAGLFCAANSAPVESDACRCKYIWKVDEAGIHLGCNTNQACMGAGVCAEKLVVVGGVNNWVCACNGGPDTNCFCEAFKTFTADGTPFVQCIDQGLCPGSLGCAQKPPTPAWSFNCQCY